MIYPELELGLSEGAAQLYNTYILAYSLSQCLIYANDLLEYRRPGMDEHVRLMSGRYVESPSMVATSRDCTRAMLEPGGPLSHWSPYPRNLVG